MTQAKIDNNGTKTAIFASNADGITPLLLYVDPTSHGLVIDDNTTGTDQGRNPAVRDLNADPVMLGVSSSDGITPVEPYIDSATNKLLINSS